LTALSNNMDILIRVEIRISKWSRRSRRARWLWHLHCRQLCYIFCISFQFIFGLSAFWGPEPLVIVPKISQNFPLTRIRGSWAMPMFLKIAAKSRKNHVRVCVWVCAGFSHTLYGYVKILYLIMACSS
jgi:hypothetical protein